jgi:hypothetical protein
MAMIKMTSRMGFESNKNKFRNKIVYNLINSKSIFLNINGKYM